MKSKLKITIELLFCEDCKDFICEECKNLESHKSHIFKNMAEELDDKHDLIENLIKDRDSIEINTNFEVIKSMKITF